TLPSLYLLYRPKPTARRLELDLRSAIAWAGSRSSPWNGPEPVTNREASTKGPKCALGSPAAGASAMAADIAGESLLIMQSHAMCARVAFARSITKRLGTTIFLCAPRRVDATAKQMRPAWGRAHRSNLEK